MMRFLFLHPNFPAQFRHLLQHLGQSGRHQMVFLTENNDVRWPAPGLRKIVVSKPTPPLFGTGSVLMPFLEKESRGQVFCQACLQLKKSGFVPDVVVFHSGWGASWYLADIFPDSLLIGTFEWYYQTDFQAGDTGQQLLGRQQNRMRNAAILNDLLISHRKITPTNWQRSQFPLQFQKGMYVLHEGIDTRYFSPDPQADLSFLQANIPPGAPLVTYASRGMEPYRGFPQFIKSLELVLEHDRRCHVVIMGEDRICYSSPSPDGRSWKQIMQTNVELDWSRVHFVGSLPYGQYKKVLQASVVHVYLTVPFVLSWSMLEAMSSGCVVIGSSTPPVMEVLVDGENGILADLQSPEDIGKKICAVLNFPDIYVTMRQRARETIVNQYDLKTMLDGHLKILMEEF